MLTRRQFLATAAFTVAPARLHAQGHGKAQVALSIPNEATGPHMPIDFVGLSYEVQQLADPRFFSAQNSGLIREFKALSSTGVLRLGGNTSEFGYWKPTPDSPEPEHPQTREVVGEPKAQYYAVTVEAVRNLAEFLWATGWTCVYGIGMGTNTPARAAEEAAFVAETLGNRLQYFQIGNEADLFDRHLRDPKTWSAKTYLEEWLTLARAIAARVPAAKFGMPDVASNVSWLTEIADQWPSIQSPPHVTTLTHHYYFGGPATNPEVNIPNLLKPATMQKVQNTANIASAAASKIGARVRMTEGNTCYRGGKPGSPTCLPLRFGQPTIHCCWPVMTIPASICTVVRANLWPIPLVDLCRATRFWKQMAKLPNRFPRIRIRSIHRLRRLARTIRWSRSRMVLSLQARSAAERC